MGSVIEAGGLEKRFGQTRALAGAGFTAGHRQPDQEGPQPRAGQGHGPARRVPDFQRAQNADADAIHPHRLHCLHCPRRGRGHGRA